MCARVYIYIYMYMLTPPPPMIHRNLLLASSGPWEVGNLRCENIASLQFPQSLQSWKCENIARLQIPQHPQNLSNYGRARLIDARIFGNFGDIGAWRGLRTQALQTLGKSEHGDVLATSDAKTLPGSNFSRFLKPEMQKVMLQEQYHAVIHEPSIASVPNCALASFIERSHSCC